MASLVGVGLVVPVLVLVVLDLVLVVLEGQVVALEGQAVWLVQQGGALEAVVMWVVLLLPWLHIYVLGPLYLSILFHIYSFPLGSLKYTYICYSIALYDSFILTLRSPSFKDPG